MARGISVISKKYRSLNVNRVNWKVAVKPRGNMMLGVKIMLS
jgi:hypothetical protein